MSLRVHKLIVVFSLAAVVIVVQPDFVFHQHASTSPHRALGLVLIFISVTLASGDSKPCDSRKRRYAEPSVLLLRKLGGRATTHILFVYCLSGLVVTPMRVSTASPHAED